MLFKSLEFKNVVGQKVKVVDIPVLEEDNSYFFLIQVRLQTFIKTVYSDKSLKRNYSFREYLKKVMRWPDYDQLFKSQELKNNA